MRIFKYFGKYKKYALIGAIAKFVEALIELSFPFIIAFIIDDGIKVNNKTLTIQLSILLTCLAFFGVSVTIFGHRLACKATYGLGSSIREKLFKHIFTLNEVDKGQLGNNSIISRLNNDVASVEKGVVMMIRLLLRAPLICLGGIILTLWLDAPLSLIIIGLVPILLLVVFFVLRLTVIHYQITQGKLDKISLNVKENITGLRVIKAFNKDEDEKIDFEQLNLDWQKSGVKTTIWANSITPFTALMMNIAITLIILFGAYRIDHNQISQGTLIAFITYVNIIVNALIQLTNLTTNISKALASSARIEAVFELVPSLSFGDKQLEKVEKIEFSHVDFNYDERKVLFDINFSLSRGQTLGIVGGTGSGKSTLAQLFARYNDVSQGEITINDESIKSFSKSSLHQTISMVFQNDTLLKGSIGDNIKMGRDLTLDQIEQALSIAQAKGFVDQCGLDYLIEENGRNLSGGQRQRLCIARAIAGNPDLLILDDSFSALDYLTDYKLRQALKQMSCSKVFVSQRISSIKDADMIILMDRGRIVARGSHQELLEHSELYRQIDRSQKKVDE